MQSSAQGTQSAPPDEKFTLAWSAMTDPGRHRSNNEDSFMAFVLDGTQTRYLGKTGTADMTEFDFVFAVSDGMGGQNLGEFASRTAVQKLTTILPKSFRISARGMNAGFQDLLAEAYQEIHRELNFLAASYPDECAGMGTTLSLCWFTPGWMFFSHVGDSRIYYLPKGGEMKQVTHDHSQVGWMRRTGRINEREARNHPGRSSLQQALGGGHQVVEPHIGAVGYQAGDRFLICSDGLIDGLWDNRIAEFLGSDHPFADLARHFVDTAIENSGRDNTTAVVIEVGAGGGGGA